MSANAPNAIYQIYLRAPIIPGAYVRGIAGFCAYLPRALRSLYRFLTEGHVEIVHVIYPVGSLFYFALLRPWARWKLVVSLQGSDINRFFLQPVWARLFIRWLFSSSDTITVCATSLQQKLGLVSSRYLAKSIVVPNANPLPTAGEGAPVLPGLPDRFVLTVGNLIHRKGHDVLIRAVRVLKDRDCRVNLVIIGIGEEEAALRRLTDDLGVDDRVFFVGEVTHAGLAAYYERCSTFVLASRSEGMPLVLLEAMAFQRAVVATNVDGIPDLVRDGDNGFLVPPEDPEALAVVLLRLQNEPLLCTDVGRRAGLVAHEHSWTRFTERHLELYASI